MKSVHAILLFLTEITLATAQVKLLTPHVRYDIPSKASAKLDIYEFEPLDRLPYRLFTTTKCVLNISMNGADGSSIYEVYRAPNKSSLVDEWSSASRFFGVFRRVNEWHARTLPPFERVYIGIDTRVPYAIKVQVTNVDLGRILLTFGAIALYLSARRLARTQLFYYTAGCSTGLLASLAIVVFILYRILPRRSFAYSFLVGGWSFSLYCAYALWTNMHQYLIEYQKYIAVYVVSVLVVSFAVCYRLGVPKNERSLNLTQWALQALALITLYMACQLEEVSVIIGGVLLAHLLAPEGTRIHARNLWYRWRGHPPRRLITEAEYIAEGSVATERALAELRSYCSSPDCDAWRVMSRLKTPRRFASFVANGSHLNDAELLDYDNYSIVRDVDEDDDEEELENLEPSILDDEENDVYLDSPAITPARANRSSVASSHLRRQLAERGYHQAITPHVVSPSSHRDATPDSLHSVDVLNARVLQYNRHGTTQHSRITQRRSGGMDRAATVDRFGATQNSPDVSSDED